MAKDPYRYFKIEAKEILEGFSHGLLALEKKPADKELLNELFRYAHTLKGSARLVKLPNIGDMGHRIEDYLGEAKIGKRILKKNDIDLFFKCLDKIKEILACVESGANPLLDVTDIVNQLLIGLGHEVDIPTDINSKTENMPETKGAPKTKKTSEKKAIKKPTDQLSTGSIPTEISPSPTAITDDKEAEEIPNKKTKPSNAEETIRVDLEKINTVMNLSSELVINKIKLEDKINKLKDLRYAVNVNTDMMESLPYLINNEDFIHLIKRNPKLNEVVNNLVEGLTLQKQVREDLAKIVEGYEEDIKLTNQISLRLQEETFKARMLPANSMLNEMRRMVRDIAGELNKEIEFTIKGGALEIDKQILDEMKAPIMHILRNALDHGIESIEDRKRSGKRPKGRITVTVGLVGSNLTISIEDDGMGIDTEKVKQSAINARLISKEQAAMMNDSDAVYLVLEAGLSTAEIISDLSGRGVGMDVVSTAISQLRGSLIIHSTPKVGTRFQINLPQSLANLSCLLCRAGGQRLLIPLSSVAKTLRIEPELIISESNQDVIRLFDQVIPLIPMPQVLNLPKDPQNHNKIPLVVLKYRDEYMAFAVERLMGVHDVVVKHLGNHIKKVSKVAGATILGDGSTVIIINSAELVQDAKRNSTQTSLITRDETKKDIALPLLVVDDSLTTRMMEKSILESAGYAVDLAVSGEDALEKVTKKQYSLVISDVEMPGIDGFELTKTIKEIDAYSDTPIVIVSSLDTEDVKRQGIEAGARAYIVKGEFQQNTLLETISYLI